MRDWNLLDTMSRSKLIPQPPVDISKFLLLTLCTPAVTGWTYCWVFKLPKVMVVYSC